MSSDNESQLRPLILDIGNNIFRIGWAGEDYPAIISPSVYVNKTDFLFVSDIIDGLEEIFRTILQIGCNDVSQAIGHFFSCTESVVKLALQAGMPQAKNHLFLLTQYLMQSSPIVITSYQTPTRTLKEILSSLVRKRGFVSYHYMILVNGLVNNKDFVGEKHYFHALHGLETVLPQLTDELTTEKLDSMIKNEARSKNALKDLKKRIWRGEKTKAFAMLRQVLEEELARRRHHPHGAENGLHDHGCELVRVLLDQADRQLRLVVRSNHRVPEHALGNAPIDRQGVRPLLPSQRK